MARPGSCFLFLLLLRLNIPVSLPSGSIAKPLGQQAGQRQALDEPLVGVGHLAQEPASPARNSSLGGNASRQQLYVFYLSL